jgi:hypothetical protein
MNLDRTFDIQVNGQTDVAGLGLGALGTVDANGWDYGAARLGISNDYILDGTLGANSTLTSTLSWLRARSWDEVNITISDVAQADLNLSIWQLDDNLDFTTQVARSESLYNTVEHLAFTLPETGRYGIRIEYDANTFDNTVNTVWGSEGIEQTYGLAWDVIAVPEAGALVLFSTLSLALFLGLRRRDGTPPGIPLQRNNGRP